MSLFSRRKADRNRHSQIYAFVCAILKDGDKNGIDNSDDAASCDSGYDDSVLSLTFLLHEAGIREKGAAG